MNEHSFVIWYFAVGLYVSNLNTEFNETYRQEQRHAYEKSSIARPTHLESKGRELGAETKGHRGRD